MMNNEEKAKMFNQLLLEHDDKSYEMSSIQSKFDLSKEDEIRIRILKKEMEDIQRKAMSLGTI